MSYFSNFFKSIAFVLSVSILSFTLSYFVLAWTEPASTPPAGNVSAPLNVSSASQSKEGWLGVGGIFTPAMPMDVRNTSTESFWVRNSTTYLFAGADNTNKRARIGAYEEGVGWKNLIINEGGGNVGIGTTTPTTGKLVVSGGNVDVSNNRITNVAAPTASADAATKGYVDAASGGGCYEVFGQNTCYTGYNAVVQGYSTIYVADVNAEPVGTLKCSPILHTTYDANGMFSLSFSASSKDYKRTPVNNEPCAICCK